MMSRFLPLLPANGPAWLPAFADSIASLFRQAMPAPLRKRAYAVAELPSPADFSCATAFVTDANATTFASIVAGGGANIVSVYSDGTHWRIG